MNPVITALLVLLPLALIMGCAAYLAKRSATGMPVKRTLALNLSCFLVVLLIAGCFAFAVSAEDAATTTAVMTAAEKAASNESMGLGLLAAALVTGLAGIGGGLVRVEYSNGTVLLINHSATPQQAEGHEVAAHSYLRLDPRRA